MFSAIFFLFLNPTQALKEQRKEGVAMPLLHNTCHLGNVIHLKNNTSGGTENKRQV